MLSENRKGECTFLRYDIRFTYIIITSCLQPQAVVDHDYDANDKKKQNHRPGSSQGGGGGGGKVVPQKTHGSTPR